MDTRLAEQTPLRIMRLDVTNFGVIGCVQLAPEQLDAAGNMVQVTGEYGSGKTTLLNALATVFGGSTFMPEEPIRRGAQKAEVLVVLGCDGREVFRIREVLKQGAAPRLMVHDADGNPVASPRGFLDGLVGGKLALKPLAFLALDAKEQAQAVLKAAGIDLAELDARRAKAYDTREANNRVVLRLAKQLEGMPPVNLSDGATERSLGAVLARQQELLAQTARNDAQRAAAQRERDAADGAQRAYAQAESASAAQQREVTRLEQALADARAELARREAAVLAALDAATRAESKADDAETATAALVDPDLNPIMLELAGLEDYNNKVAAAKRRAETAASHAAAAAESAALTETIESVDKEKTRLLASIDLGVKGLTVQDGQLMLNGFPLSAASKTEKLLAAVAVGLQGKRLPIVLVEEAAMLSPKGMAELADFARARGATIWVERVLTGGRPEGVVLVDGAVEGAESPE